MKKAFQKDDVFLADVRRTLDSGGRRLWWLGQSGFLIAQNGRVMLLDPYLSDSLTRKYAATDKPHVRITERVIDPAALGSVGRIDLITSSHNHTDHLDAETLLPLLRSNPEARLVAPDANRDFVLERLGTELAEQIVGANAGVEIAVGEVRITGVPSAHPTVEKDDKGRCKFLGYVIHWGDLTLYHSGDTLWHEGLVPALKRYAIDLALLPINGDRPERRVAGNLDGPQAAQLTRDIGAKCVIPCHYDLFEFNTASPDAFASECRRLGQEHHVLQNGQGLDL